jgi:hypothetical protein
MIPNGWKLVPVEPTLEMLLAEDLSLPPPGSEDDWSAFAKASWAAMLDAAPEPPEAIIDDAMVKRAVSAYLRSRGTYEGEVPVDDNDIRAALFAAFNLEPKA